MSGGLAFRFTAKESKFVALMLDRAAALGEVHNAAAKLAESLRARGVQAHAIEQALALEQLPAKQFKPDFGLCVMPWGKHRGCPFVDIPPHELRSAIRWAKSKPEVARRFAEFIGDAQAFLKQGQN